MVFQENNKFGKKVLGFRKIFNSIKSHKTKINKMQLALMLNKLDLIGEINENFECSNEKDFKILKILQKFGADRNGKIRLNFLERFLLIFHELQQNFCSLKRYDRQRQNRESLGEFFDQTKNDSLFRSNLEDLRLEHLKQSSAFTFEEKENKNKKKKPSKHLLRKKSTKKMMCKSNEKKTGQNFLGRKRTLKYKKDQNFKKKSKEINTKKNSFKNNSKKSQNKLLFEVAINFKDQSQKLQIFKNDDVFRVAE